MSGKCRFASLATCKTSHLAADYVRTSGTDNLSRSRQIIPRGDSVVRFVNSSFPAYLGLFRPAQGYRQIPSNLSAKGQGGQSNCSREESNLHGFPHTVLSRTRLPVPPREQKQWGLTMRAWQCACKVKTGERWPAWVNLIAFCERAPPIDVLCAPGQGNARDQHN
jgi:hypothetical protein